MYVERWNDSKNTETFEDLKICECENENWKQLKQWLVKEETIHRFKREKHQWKSQWNGAEKAW